LSASKRVNGSHIWLVVFLKIIFFVLRAVHVIAGLFDRYIWDPVWDWLVRRASSGGVPKEMAADLDATPMFQPTMSVLVGRMVSRAKIDSRAAQLAVLEMQVAICQAHVCKMIFCMFFFVNPKESPSFQCTPHVR
jgi:hypothetical protein